MRSARVLPLRSQRGSHSAVTGPTAIPGVVESGGVVGVMPKKQKKGGKGGSKAPPPAAAAASKAVVVSDEDEDVGAAALAQVRPIVRVQFVVRALT